jgi:hypothetical protein
VLPLLDPSRKTKLTQQLRASGAKRQFTSRRAHNSTPERRFNIVPAPVPNHDDQAAENFFGTRAARLSCTFATF